MIHQLKSWPEYFRPISAGSKTFDLRKDDRDYKVGDVVHFEEFRPTLAEYTGHIARRRIIYILRNFEGLQADYCILGLEEAFEGPAP